MCTGCVQLLVGRCALGAVDAEAQVEAVTQRPDAGGGQVGRAEIARALAVVRVEFDAVVTATQLQFQRAELLFLQHE